MPNARRLTSSSLVILALTAAAPAAAAASSTVVADPSTVAPGDRYVLYGSDWSTSDKCKPRVVVSRRLNHGVRIGSARIASDGTFAFSRRVAAKARRGSRIVLDVTQYCGGVGATRTVKLRVGRRAKACGAITVGERRFDVAVFGGLKCDPGTHAIGAFIDAGIDPKGFDCAHVDRDLTGHDYVCSATGDPGRRVIAREQP